MNPSTVHAEEQSLHEVSPASTTADTVGRGPTKSWLNFWRTMDTVLRDPEHRLAARIGTILGRDPTSPMGRSKQQQLGQASSTGEPVVANAVRGEGPDR
jgi:hypothetical protein